jgi:DNA replication protein DnaC
MSRDVVISELIQQETRQLKMPAAARAFEALGRQAREEKWSFEDYLHEVLSVEVASRRESAVRQRIREAHFPEIKTLDQFDFAAAEGIDAVQIADLARGDWIERGDNVLLAGPIGTGKTHLGIALGIEAAKQRHHVAFARAADLVRMLVEARDARELGRTQRRLDRVRLLILDEVGCAPRGANEPRGARAPPGTVAAVPRS